MEKYIEWELKNNPECFYKPRSGKYVDLAIVRHVVANINKPENVSDKDFMEVLEAVAGEVDLIPATDVGPHLISPISFNTGDTVYLEMYNHSTGRNFVIPVIVEWLDNAGVCFVNAAGFSIYNRIDDFNEKNSNATFGWRCWNLYPTNAKRDATPWA